MAEVRGPALVVGAGLLGGAVLRRLGPDGTRAEAIPWGSPTETAERLRSHGRRLAGERDWRAAWCAGAAVVGASGETMRQERAALAAFLEGLADGGHPGRLFVASSAGGVHGRGGPELVTETSPPCPRSAYGIGKLAIEDLVSGWADGAGATVLVGRISNLYGPAQDLSKAQGLVSHLCRNALNRQPTQIRVPLETTRDFLHADDAAVRIVDWMSRGVARPRSGGVMTKLVVSGIPTTLARAVALVRAVSRGRMLLVHVDDGRRSDQPLYLRFRSTVLTDLDRSHPPRPLEVGIAEVFESLRRQRASGQFA